MWVTKLLISQVKKRIFCPKTTKFGPKLAFLVNFGQAMQAYLVPCWWVAGGCGARAVSRKTPIYFMLSGILSYLDPIQCGDWWCDTAWVNWMKNIPKYSFVRSSLALQKWAIVIAWDMGGKMQKNQALPFIQEISRKIYVSSFYQHLGSGFK